MEARERIRLDGVPISKELFCEHFWSCWDRFTPPARVPAYFRFTAIMALQVSVPIHLQLSHDLDILRCEG